jgi:solute carrier family 45 protein 1/2/4
MICAAVTLIGFSADLGYFLGDTTEHCRTYKGSRYRAATVFILGFWMLDLANNTVQGPARALLADLSGPDQCNSANAIFCSWMAVGNILGFSAGASGNWHKWFPFLTTRACCEACGNLKAAFLVAVVSFQ